MMGARMTGNTNRPRTRRRPRPRFRLVRPKHQILQTEIALKALIHSSNAPIHPALPSRGRRRGRLRYLRVEHLLQDGAQDRPDMSG